MGITVLAFDFGTKSIGCAVGQSITGTAQALPAFKAQDGIPNWIAIENCLKEWKPDVLVVGLPLNMDGTIQDLTLRAKNLLTGCMGVLVLLLSYKMNVLQQWKRVVRYLNVVVSDRLKRIRSMVFLLA